MNSILNLISIFPTSVLFILGTITIVLGDLYAKHWSLSHSNMHASLGMVFYILGGAIFISIVNKSHAVGVSNVIWNILGIAGTLIIGSVFFQEVLSIKQWVGIILGVVSIAIISY